MNRRHVLASAGCCGFVPLLWFAGRRPRRSVELRYWLSERAGTYEVRDRVRGYLEAALEPAYDAVDVTFGGTVAVETEDGYAVTNSGEWPKRVVTGYASDEVEPVGDVNLLVTDGPMHDAPTGAGMTHFASVGGASKLERVPPRDELDAVVPYTTDLANMHVLVHEVGHAFGLEHDHGTITRVDGATVASPMVSTYAWTGDAATFGGQAGCGKGDSGTDGDPDPDPDLDHGSDPETTGIRYLSFDFSACARTALRDYRGGVLP